MKRSTVALIAAFCLALGVAGAAAGQEIQVGATTTPLVAPTCPADAQGSACTIVLARTTAVETIRDGVGNPTVVKQSGVISAFSVGISQISTDAATQKQYVSSLNTSFGGPPEVQLTVLRAIGRPNAQTRQVVAQSPVFSVANYLGQVVEFPLVAPIPVVRGEVVALTVPTWAPVLSIELPTSKFAYRQARSSGCTTGTTVSFAQSNLAALETYGCRYSGTRVEYTATEITTPTPSS